ncbi:MAG: acetate/propionate family kinase [Acidimicrobiia bacterium]
MERAAGQQLTLFPERVVLTVNTGSSSIKCSLARVTNGDVVPLTRVQREATEQNRSKVLDAILSDLARADLPTPESAGHRVVHGGVRYQSPVLIDATVLDELRALMPLAPLHQPAALDGIAAVSRHYPHLAQVACFDTAFHHDLPEVAKRLPLPDELWEAGVRRYGFHGLSYEHIVATVGPGELGHAVLAHLGSGASLAAVHHGRSVDTTMAFTPASGILMSTRAGDLDPSILVYLAREQGYTPDALEQLIEGESGLLALSGSTADMRALLDARATDPRAALAVATFCYRVRAQIGAYAAVLGGLDTLVFTGGIGERSGPIRAEICDGLEHLGVRIDAAANDRNDHIIGKPKHGCTVRVVPTDEELVIARHTASFVSDA